MLLGDTVVLVLVLVVVEVGLVKVFRDVEDDVVVEEDEVDVNEDEADDEEEVVVDVVGAAVGTLSRNAGSALFAILS